MKILWFNLFNAQLTFFFAQPKPIDVSVISHHMQRYAVWFGGSMLASTVSTQAIVNFYYLFDTIFFFI